MNEEQMRLMLEENESHSNYEDENDSEVEDILEVQEENSDTEQEGDLENESYVVPQTSAHYYVGKDNVTRWNENCPSSAVRIRSKNIVKQLPGIKGGARHLKKPGEIWKLFFSENVINLITKYTNQHIERLTSQFTRETDCNLVDELEVQAFLGLLLFAGVRKNSRLNAKDLFRTDGSSPEIFRLTMSWNRFYFLMRCIRFDDKESRSQRASVDKLAPIRDLFEEVVSTFKKYFSASQFVTIDEKLEAFRGRCNFRKYIPSKPNKYGIKIYAMCDAKMFYTFNMEVYVGKQPDGPYKVDTASLALVIRLSDVIHKTNCNSSIPLVDKLLHDYKLTMIGTIRKNKKELPKDFIDVRGRREGSSLFGHRNSCTLVSHVPKKNKNVLLISSMHDDQRINEENGKPEIIMDYNATKGGVDTVDKMCETYNCARGTNRWPMVVFYSLMNVAGINSYVIYLLNNPNTKTNRRIFLEELSYDLINPHIKRRALNTNLPRMIKERILQICKLDAPDNVTSHNDKVGRCSFCSSKKP